MTNRVLLETVAALFGSACALGGAFALVAGLLWLSDQSGQTDELTLLAAIALVLGAVAARAARQGVLTLLARLPTAH